MTDKELLQFAAKAAGLEDAEWQEDSQCINYERTDRPHFRRARWNPLTDDGDALRLAVKLELLLDLYGDHYGNEIVASFDDGSYSTFKEEPRGDDPYAATRRAIVRAAAEIGRSMK